MRKKAFWPAAVLAACWASATVSPAGAIPPAGGTIAVDVKPGNDDFASSLPLFVNAAGEALSEKGFTILDDPAHAAYVVELILTRTDVGTGSAKAVAGAATVSPGSAAGVGAGVTIPLPSGKSRLVPIQRTRLEMRIRKRDGSDILWDGAAVTVRESGTKRGSDATVATDLSEALIRGYPDAPDNDLGVP